jgi:hypothetical protein
MTVFIVISSDTTQEAVPENTDYLPPIICETWINRMWRQCEASRKVAAQCEAQSGAVSVVTRRCETETSIGRSSMETSQRILATFYCWELCVGYWTITVKLKKNVLKNAVFWDVASCRCFVNRPFGGTYPLHLQGIRNPRAIFYTLKMEGIRSSETSINKISTRATSQKTAFFVVTTVKTSNF